MKATRAREGDKREELIRFGVSVFTEKGFYNTSLDEIVKAVGVPKGSFAYYFGSKDAYTVEVIHRYAEYFNKKLDRILCDESMTPIDRLEAFMEEAAIGMERFDFRRGCLVGNLGQELAALDDSFREALLATLRGWQVRVQNCLDEAKRVGQLGQTADCEGLGRLFWYAWEGAVLGAKLEKSRGPLDAVRKALVEHLRAQGAT
ncbi:TetR/AcrR family transcriptional regulator [Cupriavidus sp. 2SB]|uniref:TetR/AcrR family transcriptional regulator n=1 Tax=Cupriavidus sp. 2SB TaxID=2502199 RepID=UPI0010F9FD27|nr:TetR/AcrR family transcriptional regulator [Cupriavidus sp. 2SB]